MHWLPIVTNTFKELDGMIDRLKRKLCGNRTRANLSSSFLDYAYLVPNTHVPDIT